MINIHISIKENDTMKVKVMINKTYGEPYAIYQQELKKINIYPLLTKREQTKINKSYESIIEIIISKKLFNAIKS